MKNILLLLPLLLGSLSYAQVDPDTGELDLNLLSEQVRGITGGKNSYQIAIDPAPKIPQNLSETILDSQIDFTWDAVDDVDLVGYILYRSEDDITFYPHTTGFNVPADVITNLPLTFTSYNDTNVTPTNTYYYRVLAVDASGKKSGFSNKVTALAAGTPGDTTAPAAPVLLTVTPTDVSNTVVWAASSATDLDYYSVYYDTATPITTGDTSVDVAGLEHNFTGLTNSTAYYYAVTATDISGNESALSNEITSTTGVTPAAGGVTDYSYYRFRATDDNYNGDARWGLTEIYGYESNDNTGTNVFATYYSTALANSGTNEDHRVFDGNTGTYWDSFPKTSGDHRNIYVQMTGAYGVRSITVDPGPNFGFDWIMKQFVVEGSNDGSSWDVLATINQANTYSNQSFTDIQTPSDPAATDYFHYKFEATAVNTNTSDYRWEIAELQGYESNDNTGTNVFAANFLAATASSGLNEDHKPFDGSTGTYWDSFPQAGVTWIAVELDTAMGIRSVTLDPFGFNWNPATINIYGSNNGTDWTLLAENQALSQDNNNKTIVDIQTGGVDPPVVTPQDLAVDEIGHRHISLSWSDFGGDWDDPVIIQRQTTDPDTTAFTDPTDLTNNQAANNEGAGTFRFLGLNATNYTDLTDLAEGTKYYYRVAKVTNLKAHYDSAATPTFSAWKYGEATTGTIPASQKVTYDVTQAPYNADNTGATNAYDAIKDAWDDAIAAGGGIVYLPAGTYKVYPTDADISDVGGIPTADPGDSYTGTLFPITSDNMTFLGDGSGSTIVNLRLWNDNPATEWLQVRNASQVVTNIKRYFMFRTTDTVDFILKDMTINGGATPVNTGKQWYSLDQKRYQWDISHKLIASFDNTRGKNTTVDGVVTNDWRGEVYYTGGISGKYLIMDSTIQRTNSSAISMSASAELVNVTIKDASNAAVESAAFAGVADFETGRTFNQNTIARGCTFDQLDQSGTMVTLPGERDGFWGWQVFNQQETYQSLTDHTWLDTGTAAYTPWHDCYNALLFNWTVTGSHKTPNFASIIDWRTAGTSDFGLAGGMEDHLILGGTINVDQSYGGHQPFFLNFSAGNDEINRVVSSLELVNASGSNRTINDFFLDRNSHGSRAGFLFEDFTTSGANSTSVNNLYNGTNTQPTYTNVFP